MSQLTDVAEKVSRVNGRSSINDEPELSLCLSVDCCSQLTNIQNFWLLW